MRDTFQISAGIAIIISIISTGIIHLIIGVERSILATIFIVLTFINFLILSLIFELLIYRQLNNLLNIFKKLKNQRLDEIEFDNGGVRLPIFNKLFKRAFRHFYRVQKKIDGLTKLAAFRKEFIADVSHELKTPIFAAQGFVHTLLDGAIQDKTVSTKFLEKAAKSLDGLDLLVHDLLTLSHIEIGETKMHFEYFDLRTLISEVVEQFEKKADDKKITIEVQRVEKSMVVYADWLRIKQVMSNLISNAIKYSKEEGKVTIGIKQEKDDVLIAVKDNGVGIPEHDLDRIFERFYRVDKSRSREKGGTGLGLAIVKHILEGHNSTIEVESELGEGSLFVFSLPRGKE